MSRTVFLSSRRQAQPMSIVQNFELPVSGDVLMRRSLAERLTQTDLNDSINNLLESKYTV